MSRTYIVVENAVEFAVYSEEDGLPVAALPHDEDFPPLNEEGYEHEFVDHDGADEDSLAFSYEGCPLGYVVVIIKRRGHKPFCLLYGPDGFIGFYPDEVAARAAAANHAENRPSRGLGRDSGG